VRRHRPDDLWSHIREVVAFLFTIGASVISIGHWTAGPAQVVLRIVAVISAGYAALLFSAGYLAARDRDRLTADQFARDIVDIVTRQSSPNKERVSVDIVIGRRDTDDQVTEEIEVTPDRQFIHRLIRPVMPDHWKMPRRLTDIDFRCSVDDGSDGPVQVRYRPIRTAEYLQIWLIFVPTVTATTTWRFSYRPKGLWRELRRTGRDRLVWHDTMPAEGRSPMVDFRIRFLFSNPDYKPRVAELSGLGSVTRPVQLPDGRWVVVWHDDNPQGRRYEWTLTHSPWPQDSQRTFRIWPRRRPAEPARELLHTWDMGPLQEDQGKFSDPEDSRNAQEEEQG
jgi:hypothetical protein